MVKYTVVTTVTKTYCSNYSTLYLLLKTYYNQFVIIKFILTFAILYVGSWQSGEFFRGEL